MFERSCSHVHVSTCGVAPKNKTERKGKDPAFYFKAPEFVGSCVNIWPCLNGGNHV